MTHSKRVVVTGVSGGIGSACATRFADDGWEVIGFDRAPPPPTFTGTYVQCDINVSAQIGAACDIVLDLGPLDALVNNAAVQVNQPLSKTTDEQWDLVILVRHASVKRFMNFAIDDAYLAGAGHRAAALADSRLLPLERMPEQ